MKTELSFAALLTLWYLIKKWYSAIEKVIEPLIKEAEQLALDGIIDKNDRKKLVWMAIDSLQAQGRIQKMGFITRWIVSRIIDMIAGKLPDFKITKEIQDIVQANAEDPGTRL